MLGVKGTEDRGGCMTASVRARRRLQPAHGQAQRRGLAAQPVFLCRPAGLLGQAVARQEPVDLQRRAVHRPNGPAVHRHCDAGARPQLLGNDHGIEYTAPIWGDFSATVQTGLGEQTDGFTTLRKDGVSKAAVIGMTKALAADHVQQGLRCNALCPGTVDTPSLRERIAAAADRVHAERDFIARQPVACLAVTEDIAPQVVNPLSDESRFVTGQVVLVDGGVTI